MKFKETHDCLELIKKSKECVLELYCRLQQNPHPVLNEKDGLGDLHDTMSYLEIAMESLEDADDKLTNTDKAKSLSADLVEKGKLFKLLK